MINIEQIIEYIKQNYEPISIIVYGSYADGSKNDHSDFDALVISKNYKKYHDVSFVGETQLDVFIYPSTYFDYEINWEEFVQIFDGQIIMDTKEYGKSLKNRVLEYIDKIPCKSKEEIATQIQWCKKMLLRTKRNDAEGMFRWHWMLVDSLEIFCEAMHYPYWGPKKSLTWMKKQHPEAFECYANALFHFDVVAVENWINYLEKLS